MAELEFAPTEEREPTPRGPGKVVFQIVSGDSYLFPDGGLEFGEVQPLSGDPCIIAEDGMLEDTIADLLEDTEFSRVGWFVVEDFVASFTKDYWGESDVDCSCKEIRPARWSDIIEAGLLNPAAKHRIRGVVHALVPPEWSP